MGTLSKGLAGVGVLAAALAIFVSMKSERRPESTAAPAATEAPLPRPTAVVEERALPAAPRFLAPSGADDAALAKKSLDARRALVKTVRMPNGIEATMFPARATYPAGASIELVLDLKQPDGSPLLGRGDMQITSDDEGATPQGFMEDTSKPGRYRALVSSRGAEQKRAHLVTTVSETGLVNSPGSVEALSVVVDHAAPVRFDGARAHGTWTAEGLDVVVAIHATKSSSVALRAELVGEDGTTITESTARSIVEAGRGMLTMRFAVNGADPRTKTVTLANATLFAGEPAEWSDFLDHPLRVATK